jgi:glycosyltransferase involved in cell wall biosynthesis
MRAMVQCRTQVFQEFMAEVDHVIAVCDWVKRVLILNRVPEAKITLIRQGLCHDPPARVATPAPVETPDRPLRLVFLGRLDPTKGLDVLIAAIGADPELKVTLDVYGVLQGDGQDAYQQKLQTMISADPRVVLKAPIPADQVVATLGAYDLLVVPSQWLETGPMVVLEAFAAGVPVAGSRLGGIAELVTDGVDGRLVEASSERAWLELLRVLVSDRQKLVKLKSSVNLPLGMTTVASKMRYIYTQVLSNEQIHD